MNSQFNALKGTYGIAWSASNPSITYCDDWCTDAYKHVFASTGRGDLQKLKTLGFNLVRTYYWDTERSHVSFLQEAERIGMGVEVPIHNGLVHNRDIRGITKLVNEAKGFSCVKVYTVGNEMPDADADNVAWALQTVARLDPSRPVMHSSIFDDNYKTAKSIVRRLDDATRARYIAGVNMYFYGNQPVTWGDCLQGAVNNWYKDAMLLDVPLMITEIGYGGIAENMAFDAIHNTLYGGFCAMQNYPKFLGFELFSYQNEAWKGNSHNENLYGIVREDAASSPRQQYYAVENFSKSGFYQTVMRAVRR